MMKKIQSKITLSKSTLFEKSIITSELFQYYCRIICDDINHKSSHKNNPSVKCVDAFRIVLTEEQKLLIKQKHGYDSQLFILLLSSDIDNHFFLDFQKHVDKGLKNNYIISKKTSITNGKNTYKKQVCNKQKVKQLPSSKVKGA